MARQASMGSQIFWMGLAVLALTFAGILSFLGVLRLSGRLTPESFASLVGVLRGTHLGIEKKEMAHFVALREMEAAQEKAEEMEKGAGPVREEALAAQMEESKRIAAEQELMRARLQREVDVLQQLRKELEEAKKKAEAERTALAEASELAAQSALDTDMAGFQKMLSNQDAEIIATDLSTIIRNGQPENAARLMKLLKPQKQSEVMAEMQEDSRQRLLPLLENRYAGISADKVVQDWAGQGLTPREMAVYLRGMPPEQALRVLRLLDRNTRTEVWEIIAPTQREAG